jgi:hypothetical protein
MIDPDNGLMDSSRFREHLTLLGIMEKRMSCIRTASRSIATLAGISLLVTSLSPAWAFTVPGSTLQSSAPIEQVQFRRWGPAAIIGGVAAGAIIGSAIAAPRYYGPAYYDGPRYYGPDYGPCWRREIDPWGREFWARAC